MKLHKKNPLLLSIIAAYTLHQGLMAESIFEEPKTAQNKEIQAQKDNNQSNKNNAKKYDELIEFKSDKQNLDYLLKDSEAKFPVDDYIWRGGKKEPYQDVSELMKEANQKKKDLDELKKEEEAKWRRELQEKLLQEKGARKGNIMLDKNGKPLLDKNGNPMYDNIMYDKYGRPILDANGNPRYKDVMYDENGNPMFDENGNLILKKDSPYKGNIMLDKDGNPILDANGNPMYDNVMYDKNGNPMYDKNGNLILKKHPIYGNLMLDENGNPMLDANGNPMYDNILYDENGYPMYDENGNLLLKNDPNKGKVLLDKNGKPILDANGNPRYSNLKYDKDGNLLKDKDGNLLLKDKDIGINRGNIMLDKNGNPLLDANGNPMYDNVLYDENGNPMYDENGNLILKDSPKAKALIAQQQRLKALEEELRKLKEARLTGNQPTPYQRRVEQNRMQSVIRNSILAERGSTPIYFSKPDSKYGVDSFSNQKNIDEATNEHRLYRTIRAGRLIPAILTTAISSDIEGIVTAQVEQDIYATMGKAVLIPRGSKVMGFYKNDNKIGQNRLAITWREIITPQGVNILLTNAIVSDNMGMNGALGAVNNKYLERYGLGFGLSTLSNVLLLAMSPKDGGNIYTQGIYEQSNESVSAIVEDIMEQQSQIKPTIEIRAGSRIYITPTAHIWFPKPKNNEVMAEFFKEE